MPRVALLTALLSLACATATPGQPLGDVRPQQPDRYAPRGEEGYARELRFAQPSANSPHSAPATTSGVHQALAQEPAIEKPRVPGSAAESSPVAAAGFNSPSHDRSAHAGHTSAHELESPGKPGPALKLPGPSQDTLAVDGDRQQGQTGGMPSLTTMLASLMVVLGLFLLMAWLLKRLQPRPAGLLSSDVLETLGRLPFAGKQQLHLLRLGNKLVLVAVSAGGAETLTEVTDPVEVDRLAGLCQQGSPHSASASFRAILSQMGKSK